MKEADGAGALIRGTERECQVRGLMVRRRREEARGLKCEGQAGGEAELVALRSNK